MVMMNCDDKGKSEIVVRFRAKNGNDTISVGDIQLLVQDFYVQEVEGNSLEAEVLAVTAREVIKKHIVEPLAEIPLKMVREIHEEWQKHKEPIEKLLQGRYANCPECGAAALSDAMHENTKFICPVCETKSVWKFIPDAKHPFCGRYILQKQGNEVKGG